MSFIVHGNATMVAYVLASAVVLCSLGWIIDRRRRIQRLGVTAPAVTSWLPAGVDLLATLIMRMRSNTLFDYTREILRTAGRTTEFSIFGSRYVLTDHPENIKAVQLSQFQDFGKGEQFHSNFKSILGDAVFATDGEVWTRNKNELLPFLTKSRPSDLGVTEHHTKKLLSILRDSPSVDVYEAIDRYQLDVSTEIFFGESTNTQLQEHHPFRDAVEELLRLASTRLLLGPLAVLLPDTVFARKSLFDMRHYMDRVVRKTLDLPLDQLLEKKSMNLMESLAVQQQDLEHIKDQLVSVLLPGKDPVTITLSWCLYELARRPDVYNRLSLEVDRVVGFNSLPDLESIQNLPLLKNVIKETLRLWHPVALNVREANKDTTLPRGGGPAGQQPVAVLKGDQVVYSVGGAQRRSEVVGFEDADNWDPARWEDWTPTNAQYNPFNIGPRVCLGRVFANQQMTYVLVRIIQTFEALEWCGHSAKYAHKGEMRMKLEMNTKCDKPIICRFIPRKEVET